MIWSIASLLITVTLIVGWVCRTDIRNRINEAAEHGIRIATFNPKTPTIAEARKLLATDQFEAWTHCPNCGRYDVHKWREPKKPQMRQPGDIGGYGIPWQLYPGLSLKMPYPSSEWGFTVIRECDCGKEWGQK